MKNPLKALTSMPVKLWAKVSHKNRLSLAIVAGGLSLSAIMLASAPQHDPTVVPEQVGPVTTMVVTPQSLSPQLQLFGKIENPNHAHLTAAVTATVTALNVMEGDQVQAGDILVQLDDADETLRLQRSHADLIDAQSRLEQTRRQQKADSAILEHMLQLYALTRSKAQRLETLAQRNLVATEQLENTRQEVARQAIQLARQQMAVDNHPNSLEIALAAVERSASLHAEQELRVQRTTIRAPFTGRISNVSVAEGDRITEGQTALSVYDLDSLRVRAAIPGTIVTAIKQAVDSGFEIRARISLGDEQLPMTLVQMAAEVKRGRSGVDGLFGLEGSGSLLELGRTVDMTVTLPLLDDVIAVPVQSLYGNNRVFTVRDGRLQSVKVAAMGQRLDERGNVLTLVRSSALFPGSQILTTTLPKASSGLRVEVLPEADLAQRLPLAAGDQHI
jgi:HlyD family secretion protein